MKEDKHYNVTEFTNLSISILVLDDFFRPALKPKQKNAQYCGHVIPSITLY